MDYAEQGKSKQPYDNVKALVAIDRSSGAIFASGVTQKGDDWGIRDAVPFRLDRLAGIHDGHSPLGQRTCHLLGSRQGAGQLEGTRDERHHTGESDTIA